MFSLIHTGPRANRFRNTTQMAVLWVQKAYPGAVKRGTGAGAVFPEDLDALKTAPFEDLFQLLDAVGWTVDFIAFYMFITMCLLGVLSDKTDTRV